MPIYAIWFVAALALLVLELASTTFFSIFLAIGAFAAGLLAFFFPDSPIWFQAVARHRRRHARRRRRPAVPGPAARADRVRRR